MNKAKENVFKKSDFEIMFKDSPDYFVIKNCKMFFEYMMVRFICFDESDNWKEEIWYPMESIFKIKRYT